MPVILRRQTILVLILGGIQLLLTAQTETIAKLRTKLVLGILLLVMTILNPLTVDHALANEDWIWSGFASDANLNHASVISDNGHKERVYLAGTSDTYPQVRVSKNRGELVPHILDSQNSLMVVVKKIHEFVVKQYKFKPANQMIGFA